MQINYPISDTGGKDFSSLEYKLLMKKLLLTVFLIVLPLSKPMASEIECVSPKETVLHFYRWYLNEIKDNKYPLTKNYKGNKLKINHWVSSSLLHKLKEIQSRDAMDYDYFTNAQDFFESWLTHIDTEVTKQTLSHSEVQLSLGEKDSLKNYKVELNQESCWKIESVEAVN